MPEEAQPCTANLRADSVTQPFSAALWSRKRVAWQPKQRSYMLDAGPCITIWAQGAGLHARNSLSAVRGTMAG